MAKQKQTLEDRYWEAYAEHAVDLTKRILKRQGSRLPIESEPKRMPKGPTHNRSSYAFARANRGVEKLIPSNDIGPVEYLPERVPSLTNVKSTFSVKNIVEYIVVKRSGSRQSIAARGFTKCCSVDQHCKRKRCAKCWALEQKALPKGEDYLIREIISGAKMKVVDPFGVHPKGKRSGGKSLDLDTRARFKLTSSQAHHKAGASSWEE